MYVVHASRRHAAARATIPVRQLQLIRAAARTLAPAVAAALILGFLTYQTFACLR